MADDYEDDLISLSGPDASVTDPLPELSPPYNGSSRMDKHKPRVTSEDSFASLADLMRCKKPYSPSPTSSLGIKSLSDRPNSKVVTVKAPSGVSPSTQSIDQPASKHVFSFISPPQFHRDSKPSIEPTFRQYHDVGPSVASQQASDFTLSKSSSPEETEYDEADMRHLEGILGQIKAMGFEDTQPIENEAPLAQWLPKGRSESDNPQPVPEVCSTIGTPFTYRFETPIGENDPVVRLTQTAWNKVITQISTLTKERMDIEPELAALRKQIEQLSTDERETGSKLGELRYQLDKSKDYKSAMSRELRQKDQELHNQKMEIATLRAKVAGKEAQQKDFEKQTAELNFLHASRGDEDKAQARVLAQAIARNQAEVEQVKARELDKTVRLIEHKDKEIADLKTIAARSQTALNDQSIRAQNLADTLSCREKIINQTQEQLLAKDRTIQQLNDTVHQLNKDIATIKQKIPQQSVIGDLKEQLHDKTSTIGKLKQELKHMERQHGLARQSIEKLEAGTALKGAAHLIIPNLSSKLPKNVFPCMECFVENVDCDNSARCHNCTVKETKCARWRCSIRHITHECLDIDQGQCRFYHDVNGWLMTREPRMKW